MTFFIILALSVSLIVLVAFLLLQQKKLSDIDSSSKKDQLQLQSEMQVLSKNLQDSLFQNTQVLNQQLHALSQNMTTSLSDTRQAVQLDLKSSGELMATIHSRLGELGEASKQIFQVGKDITSLQDLLKAPKLRGGLGEYFLEDILTQILPQEFLKFQHAFKNGQIVDAMIQAGENKICIDSKFPLESFQSLKNSTQSQDQIKFKREFSRMLKKHIDDISSKYILPAEGTYDFALMYIPAENVYYEIIIRPDDDTDPSRGIYEYALSKKVIPVSPNSLYAYLQVILIGIKGSRIQASTKEILDQISSIRHEFFKLESDFAVLGKHLGNTQKAYHKSSERLQNMNASMQKIDTPDETLIVPSRIDDPTILLSGQD